MISDIPLTFGLRVFGLDDLIRTKITNRSVYFATDMLR